MKYICVSNNKALYYHTTYDYFNGIENNAIHIDSYPIPRHKRYKLITYNSRKSAERLCDTYSRLYDNYFTVIEVEDK